MTTSSVASFFMLSLCAVTYGRSAGLGLDVVRGGFSHATGVDSGRGLNAVQGLHADAGTLGRCLPNGQWPTFDGKFDLVITWWTNVIQSEQKEHSLWPRNPLSLLQTGSTSGEKAQTRFENQAEITYMLRSFERNGMLKYVRQVILLMDADVLEKYGAPRQLNTTGPRLRVVTDKDIGVNNEGCKYAGGMSAGCGKWTKRLRMQYIPGLSDYFVFAPDDVYLLQPFDINKFWDAAQNKPKLYSYGSWVQGTCEGGEPVGGGHGPVLINKCAMHEAALQHANLGFTGGEMAGKKEVDALCLYSNFIRLHAIWYDYPRTVDSGFYVECHINYIERCSMDRAIYPPAMFMNIQGDGVSDDSPGNPIETYKAWYIFHKVFGAPSSLENGVVPPTVAPMIAPPSGAILLTSLAVAPVIAPAPVPLTRVTAAPVIA